MTPFTTFTGVAAPLMRANINTDTIIPGRYLLSPSADLARGLFSEWRFDAAGEERPDFVLNEPRYRQAEILLTGPNFGCGSSREAAVWALARYGFRAILAPKFADIFYENAFRNGLLAALVEPEALEELCLLAQGDAPHLTVDLERCEVRTAGGRSWRFAVPGPRRLALMRGDDEIAASLRNLPAIEAFETADRQARPWSYAPLLSARPAAGNISHLPTE